MLRELRAYGRRALVFDPRRSSVLDGIPALTTPAGVRQFFARHSSPASWIRTVRFQDRAAYDWLAGTVRHWRGVVWVLDDCQLLIRRPVVLDAAVEVATTGRGMGDGAGVELWVLAQRPLFLPTDVRFAVERIRTFRQTLAADLDYLAQLAGRDFARATAGLQGHACLSWPEVTERYHGLRLLRG